MYLDEIADRIGELCDMPMEGEDRRLLRIYAVLCLAKGDLTESEDVHNAWATWRAETNPAHRCLVPFSELDEETQALDDKYRDAIRQTWCENL